jgi:hypothetical protein
LELVASETYDRSTIALYANGAGLKQDLLLRIYGPKEAEYSYEFYMEVFEENGEEGECEG